MKKKCGRRLPTIYAAVRLLNVSGVDSKLGHSQAVITQNGLHSRRVFDVR